MVFPVQYSNTDWFR